MRRSFPATYANPWRPAWVGLGVTTCFSIAVVGWGLYAPVSSAAVAEGALQVETQRQAVQHPYGGVIKTLDVREGERVTKGQVLLTLQDTDPRSQLDVLQSRHDGLLAQQGRLAAERDGKTAPVYAQTLVSRQDEPGVADVMASERALMTARSRQYEAQVGVLHQKVAQLDQKIIGIQAQVVGLERQAALLEEEAVGARQLLEKGYTPKTRVLALERSAAELKAQRAERMAEIASTREAIGQAKLELAGAERARLTEITDGLRTVQADLAQVLPKIESARDILTRTSVTATATGAVVGLNVFTVGGVIQPGARLLDIVPTSNALMVDARLPLMDISEVSAGRQADVRLTNFTMRERPQISGTVSTVSADRMTDEKTGQTYYSVRVRLDPEDVRRAGVELQAGMPAQVIIPVRARTMIDYLVAPLLDQMSSAFRER